MLNFYKEVYVPEHSVDVVMKPGVDFNTEEQMAACEAAFDDGLKALLGDTLLVITNIPSLGMATFHNNEPMIVIDAHAIEFFCSTLPLKESERAVFYEIIAHEAKHVEQMREGRMIIVDRENIIWEGKEMALITPTDKDRGNVEKLTAYFNQPWEQEAFTAGLSALVSIGFKTSLEEAWVEVKEAIGITE